MDERGLSGIAGRPARVGGVVGVCLGGSRARGTHRADSDYDLGLYYRGAPDTAAPPDFAARAHALFAPPAATPRALAAVLDAADALVAEVCAAVAPRRGAAP